MNLLTASECEALGSWMVEMIRLCQETGRPTPGHDTLMKLAKALRVHRA